mmetsp:Transcript_24457/g.36283  ORF Transcript_24457/g.36283 Transcript_24457/m.36283 type:complete len:150 (+) Transcript_24457:179-628(+)|eukprot:CAMPEP_0194212380 /NCGR_PEP_ID=MMETSP0156-20130528/12183_1 /TAXON_ID=33649 /ORGANISM="Thalassionema nitzschioides, Strain L26-B" /LENGTH=149 /DNA_ID=CAMNT_0038940181 /DNA_START=114 /DNA_END=563 /DNA_ORIENTATION=+
MAEDLGNRLEEAATWTIKLIEKFSERDPSDPDTSNPWHNPQRMFDELDKARSDVIEIWRSRYDIVDQTKDNNDFGSLQTMYLEAITDAFSEVLDEMRKNDDIDLNVLVDCLKSGMDFFTQDEIALFVRDSEHDEECALTPHEIRRRELV